jgi:CheY-like chemotaxis protein
MRLVSGDDFLCWIRKPSEFCHIPIFMLSGSAITSDIEKSIQYGAKHFFVKPKAGNTWVKTAQQILDVAQEICGRTT